jgi:hypothetical protein
VATEAVALQFCLVAILPAFFFGRFGTFFTEGSAHSRRQARHGSFSFRRSGGLLDISPCSGSLFSRWHNQTRSLAIGIMVLAGAIFDLAAIR